mgnify:CR=1 FL=1
MGCDVGCDAELGLALVAVVHGAGREADAPAVGQRAGHGHAAASAGVVAYQPDVGQCVHPDGKGVGGAVDAAVGEHADALVPAYVAGGLEILGVEGGEVGVARSVLVLHVAYEGLLVDEAPGQPLGGGEVAAAVVADVDDESLAGHEVHQHLVEVALADGAGETAVRRFCNRRVCF